MPTFMFRITLSTKDGTDYMILTHMVNYTINDFLNILKEAKEKSRDSYEFMEILQLDYGFKLCVDWLNTVVHFEK